MSTLAELRDSLTAVDTKMDAIAAMVGQLRVQVATGNLVTQEDLDALAVSVAGVSTKEDAILTP